MGRGREEGRKGKEKKIIYIEETLLVMLRSWEEEGRKGEREKRKKEEKEKGSFPGRLKTLVV